MSEASKNPFPGLRPFKFHEHELFFGREEQYEQMIAKLNDTRFLAVVGTSGSGKSSLVRAGLLPALYGGLMMSAGPSWRVAVFRPKADPIRELAIALNHRRVFGDKSKENGSSLFKLSESIDWADLCSRLNREVAKDQRSPGRRIMETLPVKKQEVIKQAGSSVEIKDKSEIVQAFNDVLRRRDFFQPTDFRKVIINGEVRDLLSSGQNNLTDAEIEKLNRLLLEASYPLEIAKKGEIQTQITEVMLRRGDLGLVDVARQAKMAPEENLLVVVDQFEELFRYADISEHGPHGNQAAAFVKLLLQAKSQREIPIYVVLTMRSDYLGDCARFWDLPEAINEGQYLIPRLTRDQRREAIKGPIQLRGAHITPQLVNMLLNDMGDDPDQLPVLQHALMRTWDQWEKVHRDHESIDVDHYRAIGKMAEALSMHADEAYDQLPDDRSRAIAEKIFKCLTEKSSNDRETRRPTEMRDIRAITGAKFKELVPVINVFREEGRSFLMPSPKKPLRRTTLIDISHESLIRNWKRLKQWVNKESEAANTYCRIAETALLYGSSATLSDLELSDASRWHRETEPNSAWAANYNRYFIDHIERVYGPANSRAEKKARDAKVFDCAIDLLAKSEEARRLAQRERARQRRRLLRRTRATAAIFLVATVVCFFYWNAARREKDLNKLLIYAENMNSARSEYEQANFARAYQLLNTLANDAYLRGFEWDLSTRPSSFLATRQLDQAPFDQSDAALTVAFFSDKNQIASARKDGGITTWNLTGGALGRYKLRDLKDRISSAVFSPDGRILVTVDSARKTVTVWNATDGTYMKSLAQTSDPFEQAIGEGTDTTGETNVQSVAISPDGNFIVVSLAKRDEKGNTQNVENVIQVWDAYSFAMNLQNEYSSAFVAIAISPRGTLAIGDADGNVHFWNISTLKEEPHLRTLSKGRGAPVGVKAIAFSPDGNLVATGKANGDVEVRNLADGTVKPLVTVDGMPAHGMSIASITFSRDGEVLATASNDGSVKLWRTKDCLSPGTSSDTHKGCKEQAMLIGHSDAISSVTFLSNSNLLATATADRTIKLWDTSIEQIPSTVPFPEGQGFADSAAFVRFSPDGKTLAAVSKKGILAFWDTATMKQTTLPWNASSSAGKRFTTLAFSPLGKMLATWSPEGSISIWDTTTWHEHGSMEASKSVDKMTFSRTGDRLATWSNKDGHATIYDTKYRLTKIWDVRVPLKSTLSVVEFSSDLRILALGFLNGDVELWATSTGQLIERLVPPRNQPSERLHSIAFSREGQMLATGYADGNAKVWNASNWRQPITLRGHSGPIQALAFSNCGRRLASGSWDASVKIWNTDTSQWDLNVDLWDRTKNRQQLLTLREFGQRNAVLALSFSPDGKILAAATGNNQIKLWR